jgi:hypothetical protein
MVMQNKFYKNTARNVIKIFRILKEAGKEEGVITVSEIAKRTGLHKWTVSRTIDLWMSNFLDIVMPEELESMGMRVKLVKLSNQDMTEEQVLRSLKIRI